MTAWRNRQGKQGKGQRWGAGRHSLRKEGRSSGLAVQPQVMRLTRVSRLGMSAARLSRPVSGRDPRRTLNMICMGLVASAHRENKRTVSEDWGMLPGKGLLHFMKQRTCPWEEISVICFFHIKNMTQQNVFSAEYGCTMILTSLVAVLVSNTIWISF